MKLLADIDPNAPWWVAAGAGVIAVGIGGTKLVEAGVRAWGKWRKARTVAASEDAEASTAHQQKVRRDAADEAWAVVDRLTAELSGYDSKLKAILETHAGKIKDIEARERECSEDRALEREQHATTKAFLRMMVSWAKKQKNPPPFPDELLLQLDTDGSGTHTKSPGS